MYWECLNTKEKMFFIYFSSKNTINNSLRRMCMLHRVTKGVYLNTEWLDWIAWKVVTSFSYSSELASQSVDWEMISYRQPTLGVIIRQLMRHFRSLSFLPWKKVSANIRTLLKLKGVENNQHNKSLPIPEYHTNFA